MTKDFPEREAITAIQQVINIKPDYARALDYAAHCAFMFEDQIKGMKYAKEARKYGETQTYNDWRKGVYKKQKS